MKKDNLDAFCYIQEQTSFPEDYKSKFGFEYHKTEDGSRFFLTFPTILQSFGILNRNGREYDMDNIWNLICTDDYIQSMLKQNSWMGEIDHPNPTMKDEEMTLQRIANPDTTRTSHYIRSPRRNGNLLEANIQTDCSNENGMNMAYKIMDGKIIPCFSARVLGALTRKNGRPIVNVRKLVTYDWVLFPSHREAMAKINQPLMESVNAVSQYIGAKIIYLKELAQMAANNSKETEWLCESFGLGIDDVVGLTSTGNSVVVTEGSNVYIQPISDKRIREKTKSELRDWLNK